VLRREAGRLCQLDREVVVGPVGEQRPGPGACISLVVEVFESGPGVAVLVGIELTSALNSPMTRGASRASATPESRPDVPIQGPKPNSPPSINAFSTDAA
jgi:hypothetical protein